MRSWRTCNQVFGLVALTLLSACHRGPTGTQTEQDILRANGLVKEELYAAPLAAVLPGINCLAQSRMNRRLQLAADYNPADTTSILVIPYFSTGQQLASTAYSHVPGRYILLNPRAIRSYLQSIALDSADTEKALISLMLLHELGHFKLRKVGAFDSAVAPAASSLGEQDLGLDPIFLTTQKRLELAVDSTAVALLQPTAAKNPACFSAGVDVQLVVPKLAFQLAGLRVIRDFGSSTPGRLRDPSPSHPNMELRATYMTYYMAPSPAGRQLIDDYLYAREVEPVHRQLLDPRIYQGQEKNLPQ